MYSFKKIQLAFCLGIVFLTVVACASQTKEEIRNTESVNIQLLFTRNLMYYQNYDDAIEMFTYIRDQNPENIAVKVETEYEIAFSYWKKRDLDEAQKNFEELITFYDENELDDEVPTWPYFLSKKILEEKVLPEKGKN